MAGGGEDSTVKRDDRRHDENLKSKSWAKRDGVVWTDEEDLYIIDEWILKSASIRDEVEVSKHLQRTLFACKRRAEYLREVLDVQGPCNGRKTEERPDLCPSCNTALPKTGLCDYCE